jgi:NADH:ubiquinone oxidoreductase subunit B-like Fe-S oxidoreductase
MHSKFCQSHEAMASDRVQHKEQSLGIVLIEYSEKRKENLTAGPITMQTDPYLVRLYEQMPEPK